MMDAAFLRATSITLLVNLLYALVALVVGVLAVRWVDETIYKEIDFIEEIKKGNLAAAIYASVLVLFIGIVLHAALGR
jgi:uncharacterized membrane protein YjfL (UPF0719 family)